MDIWKVSVDILRMAAAHMKPMKAIILGLYLGIVPAFIAAQDTNVLVRMPHIAKDGDINRRLEACDMRIVKPIYQTNDISYVYRVIILRPTYKYTETLREYIRERNVDQVVFEISGQTGPTDAIPGGGHRNIDDMRYSVTRHRFSGDNSRPEIIFMKSGKWSAEDIRKWFALVHRSEIYDLPESMSIQRDNGAFVYSTGGGPLVLFERSRHGDYTVILRNLYRSLAPNSFLEELNRMFPEAGFHEAIQAPSTEAQGQTSNHKSASPNRGAAMSEGP